MNIEQDETNKHQIPSILALQTDKVQPADAFVIQKHKTPEIVDGIILDYDKLRTEIRQMGTVVREVDF